MISFKAMTTAEEWRFIRSRAYPIMCEDTQGIVAHDDTGKILAVAVLDTFTSDNCGVHFAIDNPFVIRAGFLTAIADHAFLVCGRERIFGTVPANNEKALKLDKHIGFREVTRVPNGYQTDIDLVVMCLEKTDCKWTTKIEEAA